MSENSYQNLAQRLDELPNGFPATSSGVELKILAILFTPEEAELASKLRLTLETAAEVAARLGGDPVTIRASLKSMARRGLINIGRTEQGLGYGLLPFVVGIYENQVASLDAEMAQLIENYYHEAFGFVFAVQPSVHRVIPIEESVKSDIEIHPYESAAQIVHAAKAWGVLECVCRKQKALIGEPCGHPIEICMAFSQQPGAFDQAGEVRALTEAEAMETLQRAAKAGLVHSVSNSLHGLSYICNCCTCGCGVLRGIAELGVLNAVAHSAFINTVDGDLCNACESCISGCQFDALHLELVMTVDALHCVGCGLCVPLCPEGAMSLVRRPESASEHLPVDMDEWRRQRAAARGIDLSKVL